MKTTSAEHKIQIKRVYEAATKPDGQRFLVDRLWPRGVKRESLLLVGWIKEVAPSGRLRQWFKHAPAKWNEFQTRYRAELDANPKAWQPLLQAASNGNVTLVFGARDTVHNNAVVLKGYLEERLRSGGKQ